MSPFLSSTNLTVMLTPAFVPPILSVVGREGEGGNFG